MRYGNRSIWKRVASSPILLIIVLIAFGVLTKATWNIHEKSVASAAKLARAQAELSKLQAHEEELSKRVQYLSTEEGVEAELRTKYRAVKEGESVAVIVDRSETAAAADATTSSAESQGWFSILLRKFGF